MITRGRRNSVLGVEAQIDNRERGVVRAMPMPRAVPASVNLPACHKESRTVAFRNASARNSSDSSISGSSGRLLRWPCTMPWAS